MSPGQIRVHEAACVLNAWRSWPQLEIELAWAGPLATSVAVPVGADVPATAGVERESWGTFWFRVMTVAPFHQCEQNRSQLSSLWGWDVHRPSGPFWVRHTFEHALITEQLEPVSEDVGSNPEALLEFLETSQAVDHGVAHDQQRPALADDLEGSGDRANQVGVFALQHLQKS